MTNEKKQIEEMRYYIHEAEVKFCVHCRSRRCQECEYYFAKTDCRNQLFAEHLYAKGYRRASDVAREIIEDLTRMVFSKIPNKLLLISGGQDFTDGIIDGKREAYFDMLNYLAELKKKYESEGNK